VNTVINQQQFLDQLNVAMVADYRGRGGEIYCGRGCCNCCTLAVNCTWPEAELLAGQLTEAQLESIDSHVGQLKGIAAAAAGLKDYLRRHRQVSGGCPLLARDGACSAYIHRPLSCRSLLSTKENRWCSVDFGELPAVAKEEFMASLDRPAAAFPLHYLAAAQEAGRELERQLLLQMATVNGFTIYGAMPVLVNLASRHGLGEAIAVGPAAVRELLGRTGLTSPLLVQVEEF
jgi:Fe-S-cluster containining protein